MDTRIARGLRPLGARPRIWWDGAAMFLLACTAIGVLAAPVFPTQDGPVHLYYVDILRDLLKHSGPFAQHFAIKTFLTPYAFEYYSLLALEMVFSPTVGEKLLICGYIFAFGLGFRYLVQSVAGRNSPWTLVGIPFCMNVLVYMGFLNYCVGVTLALFLWGFWIRYRLQLHFRHVIPLVAGFALMLLTHPVPTAVFLLFIGVQFGVDLARALAAGPGLWILSLRERRRQLAMIAVLAGTSAAWVGMFMNRSQQAATPSTAVSTSAIYNLTSALKLWGIAPFTSRASRAALLVPVALAILACLAGVWMHRGRISSSAIALLATSAICFTLFCFAPSSINGSSYFPNRFAVFWIMLLIAAAAALHPPAQWSRAAGVAAFCVTGALLPVQWMNVARINREMKPSLDAPLRDAKAGRVGLIIGNKPVNPPGLAFDPFLWSGVHYFRRSKAILANAPWMDSPLIAIGPVHPDRWSYVDPYPARLSLSSALRKGQTIPELNFVLAEGPPDAGIDEVTQALDRARTTANGGALTILTRP